MKFGHRFQQVIEQTHPRVSDQFLCYKTLKKCLKNIPEERGGGGGGDNDSDGSDSDRPEKAEKPSTSHTGRDTSKPCGDQLVVSADDARKRFTKLLNAELKKFNKFFMNAEEDLVMRDRELGDQFHELVGRDANFMASGDRSSANTLALSPLSKKYADFHGELVLLEHWTSLNYTALVKILKKHDKRSTVALRSPFLLSALHQPFYSTEVLLEMIAKTETRFKTLHEMILVAGSEKDTTGLSVKIGKKDGLSQKREKAQTAQTPPSLSRTKAAISCWDGLKDEDSVKRPFGDKPRGMGNKRLKTLAAV